MWESVPDIKNTQRVRHVGREDQLVSRNDLLICEGKQRRLRVGFRQNPGEEIGRDGKAAIGAARLVAVGRCRCRHQATVDLTAAHGGVFHRHDVIAEGVEAVARRQAGPITQNLSARTFDSGLLTRDHLAGFDLIFQAVEFGGVGLDGFEFAGGQITLFSFRRCYEGSGILDKRILSLTGLLKMFHRSSFLGNGRRLAAGLVGRSETASAHVSECVSVFMVCFANARD